MSDVLHMIACELTALAQGDRRAILAAFDAEDRDRLRAAMRGRPAARVARPGGRRHSSWVEGLIEAAQSDDDRLTGAARTTLLDALGQSRTAMRPNGRSLFQAAGGLLGQARAR